MGIFTDECTNIVRRRIVLKKLGVFFLAAFLVLTGSLGSYAQQASTLTQLSTIDALLSGIYDGKMSMQQLKAYGDIGLGTFNALDGEMVLVDGTVYQVSADGTVHVPGPAETTPFMAVTFFESDREKTLPSGIDMKQLTDEIDAVLPTPNLIYALRIEGSFKKVRTRSVPKQNKPYQPLTEIVKNQPTFDFENVEGVIVGLRCPPFMKGINVPGYHLHFLTKDRKAGGHVLGLTVDHAVAKVDQISNFYMILPEDQDFYRLNMENDTSSAVSAVETRN
ncbi:MAG: acetolactate decarboxylase [Syntrophobacteraceae bacterium]|jgi:acetolactate decarboxylase